jgi:hypothetical protein
VAVAPIMAARSRRRPDLREPDWRYRPLGGVGTQWCGDLISVLMVMNMPEYGRSIIYGVTILALLLLYGRETGER